MHRQLDIVASSSILFQVAGCWNRPMGAKNIELYRSVLVEKLYKNQVFSCIVLYRYIYTRSGAQYRDTDAAITVYYEHNTKAVPKYLTQSCTRHCYYCYTCGCNTRLVAVHLEPQTTLAPFKILFIRKICQSVRKACACCSHLLQCSNSTDCCVTTTNTTTNI